MLLQMCLEHLRIVTTLYIFVFNGSIQNCIPYSVKWSELGAHCVIVYQVLIPKLLAALIE